MAYVGIADDFTILGETNNLNYRRNVYHRRFRNTLIYVPLVCRLTILQQQSPPLSQPAGILAKVKQTLSITMFQPKDNLSSSCFLAPSQEIRRISMKKRKNLQKYLSILLAIITLSIVFVGCDVAIDTQSFR